ncbi:hypothetical protein GCM10027425_24020 [Alteromonas gracilis]
MSADPLAEVAPRLLLHLADAHAAELLACVRAHGHPEAEAVVPRELDRWGLVIVALTPGGVERVRLHFPGGPVDDLRLLSPGLHCLLTCRCRHRQQ